MSWFPRVSKAATLAALGLVGFTVFAGACGDDDDTDGTAAAGDIIVFAAASLTDAFTALGEGFTEANAGAGVEFNFAASSAIAAQINEGAPADVFASANADQMRVATEAGNAGEPVIFATNSPVVVVPADNTEIETFEGLGGDGYSLVLAGPDVPIGQYAREVLANASSGSGGIAADFSDRVLANLVSEESNVRAVLTKVELGEADVGIVYGTDAAIAGDSVRVIEIPEAYNVVAEYPIAVVEASSEPETAAAFVEFVLSAAGQAILAEHGFGAP